MRMLILVGTIFLSCSPSRQAASENETSNGGTAVPTETISRASENERMAVETGTRERDNTSSVQQEFGKQNSEQKGLTARYVAVKREEDAFVYPDGFRAGIVSTAVESNIRESLQAPLQRGMEVESKSMRMRVACAGGYEVCLEGQMYLYYEEKDASGRCVGAWYAIDGSCNDK